jgi:exo-beta-1,3-glucanase (GH17 family)
MKKQNSVLVFIAAALVALSSCNSPKSDSDANKTTDSIATSVVDTTPINEVANYKFSYAIANVPSPLEILDEFAKSELPVYTNLLNPVENVDNYQSSLKQTFNYGIYGVDLGYL